MQGPMPDLEIALREVKGSPLPSTGSATEIAPEPRAGAGLWAFVRRLRPEWALLIGALVVGA
jgi:hypothetical protein